jgi:hypothetical protein
VESLPTPDERVYDELSELLDLPEGASYKEFAKRIRQAYTDFETQNQILLRFEYSQLDEYPALTEYLSGLTNEEKETFLFSGGLQSIVPFEVRTEKPWDEDPYKGDSEWYRNDLHDGVYTSGDPEDLPGLAMEWPEELARVGYQGVIFYRYGGLTYQLPAKQETSSEAIPQPLRVSAQAGPAYFNDGSSFSE